MSESDARPRAYLAGPVQHAPENGRTWRANVEANYADQIRPLNPLKKYDVPAGAVVLANHHDEAALAEIPDDRIVSAREIVGSDKDMIRIAEAVLCRWDDTVSSAGTPMEVFFAAHIGTPVVVWYEGDALSPWIEHHATAVVDDLEAAIARVREVVGR